MLTANALRSKFLDFFRQRGHAIIPSASLIPENDPSALFTNSGMHPLVPYLLGEAHPEGKRLADAQKCIRTGDIEDVGDDTHLTFFEMLGNWSLGDYFKEEAITWSHEFLTRPEWLGIDQARLSVTVFAGDADAPRDEEAAEIWRGLGIPAERVFYLGKGDNWWGPAGQTGPCGPDTEMFYDTGKPLHAGCQPGCHCGKYVEIWNDVFMQYFKNADGAFKPLAQQNVDTGMGLERTLAVLNGLPSVYETEVFAPTIKAIRDLARGSDQRSIRVIADHLRAAAFIMGDPRGVGPSNVDQGYIVRRLIRRAIRHGKLLGIDGPFTRIIADTVVEYYRDVYPELKQNEARILDALGREEDKFSRTLQKGLQEIGKYISELKTKGNGPPSPEATGGEGSAGVTGDQLFYFYETFGFPLEMIEESLKEQGLLVSDDVKQQFREQFQQAYQAHQEESRAGAQAKFAGGLADHSEETVRLHTATHLLHQALRTVLGPHVFQKGSNITKERLRFDFSHPEKVTPDQLKRVEDLVNQQIKAALPVHFELLTVEEAKARGAIGLFEDKYAMLGNKIKVYFVGDYSKEICGGPHVGNTSELGSFKIVKEEAVAAGIRRIKATVGANS